MYIWFTARPLEHYCLHHHSYDWLLW